VESCINQCYGSHFNIFYELLFSFTHSAIKNSFCISTACIIILHQIVQVNKERVKMSQHYMCELVGIFPLTISPQKLFADVHSPLHECDRLSHSPDGNVLSSCLWHR